MEPTEALILAELSLRNLIRSVLGKSWKDLPGLPSEETIADRRRGEESNRQGVNVSQEALDYLYIRDLEHIFNQKRASFGDVFADKPRFNELVRILADYRNVPFHARSLKWFESNLVTGAAGWIVANITQWRNRQNEDLEMDYPIIQSVSDEWGNELSRPRNFGAPSAFCTLDVGQIVHITCQGSDADSRRLIWRLFTADAGYPQGDARDTASGDSVTLRWEVAKEDVATYNQVMVLLAADDDFPRRISFGGGYDDSRIGAYAVRRPRTPRPPTSLL